MNTTSEDQPQEQQQHHREEADILDRPSESEHTHTEYSDYVHGHVDEDVKYATDKVYDRTNEPKTDSGAGNSAGREQSKEEKEGNPGNKNGPAPIESYIPPSLDSSVYPSSSSLDPSTPSSSYAPYGPYTPSASSYQTPEHHSSYYFTDTSGSSAPANPLPYYQQPQHGFSHQHGPPPVQPNPSPAPQLHRYGPSSSGGGGRSASRDSRDPDEGKLFVGGLSWDTTDESLRIYFSRYGRLIDSVVMKNGEGKTRGFAFVTYEDPSVVDVIMSQSQHVLDGKRVDPKPAIPRDAQTKSEKMFVGGLTLETSEDDLRAYFGQFGVVLGATLMVDQETMAPRGFGFVTFQSAADISNALACQPHVLKGAQLETTRALPKTPRIPPSNYQSSSSRPPYSQRSSSSSSSSRSAPGSYQQTPQSRQAYPPPSSSSSSSSSSYQPPYAASPPNMYAPHSQPAYYQQPPPAYYAPPQQQQQSSYLQSQHQYPPQQYPPQPYPPPSHYQNAPPVQSAYYAQVPASSSALPPSSASAMYYQQQAPPPNYYAPQPSSLPPQQQQHSRGGANRPPTGPSLQPNMAMYQSQQPSPYAPTPSGGSSAGYSAK